MKSSGIKFLIYAVLFFFVSFACCFYYGFLPEDFFQNKLRWDISPNIFGLVALFGAILVEAIHKFYYKNERRIERYIFASLTFTCLYYVIYIIIMKPYF